MFLRFMPRAAVGYDVDVLIENEFIVNKELRT